MKLYSINFNILLCFVVRLTVMEAREGRDDPKVESANYTEDLTIQRLGNNHVAARFVFHSHWRPQKRHRCQNHEHWPEDVAHEGSEWPSDRLCHFEVVFPRSVGVLMDRFKVRDLSLRMSKGHWDTQSWGNGPEDGAGGEYTPGGAEMWARLPEDDAWENWVGLRRSLSGLYCASLNAMDDAKVHEPKVMRMPMETCGATDASYEGADSGGQGWRNTTMLRGTLPREPVCTENLTPLIKMLPCRSKTGLGRLLHPMRLFQADYYSISVRATATYSLPQSKTLGVDAPDTRVFVEFLTLEQTVLAVFRPRPHLPSPVTGYPRGATSRGANSAEVHPTTVDDWSIISLLLPSKVATEWYSGTGTMLDACPVASRSAIHVLSPVGHTGSEAGDGGMSPEPERTCEASAGAGRAACDPGGQVDSADELDPNESEPGLVVTSCTLRPSADGACHKEGDPLERTVNDFLQSKLYGPMGIGSHSQASRLDIDPAASTRADPNGGGPVVPGAAAASSSQALALLDHFLAGRGGTRGVSVSHLVNLHATAAANVDFLQAVPYFMVPLLGTLRVRLIPNHDKGSPIGINPGMTADGDPISLNGTVEKDSTGPVLSLAENVTLTPGAGKRPTVFEVRLWVPAGSTLVLGFDYFKRFLTVEDFPPDPSRGFDVSPPLARFEFVEEELANQGVCKAASGAAGSCGDEDRSEAPILADGRIDRSNPNSTGARSTIGRRVVYAYGEAGLMDTPQPDFSMPFNVITFTSTIVTFFLGTAINLLVRKRADRRQGDARKAPRGLLGRAWQAWRQ